MNEYQETFNKLEEDINTLGEMYEHIPGEEEEGNQKQIVGDAYVDLKKAAFYLSEGIRMFNKLK